MPITLQDAIERAKLAADEEGLLSSGTYDQLVDALKFEDKYAFTMALVDIGIVPKHGGRANIAHMREVLAFDAESVDHPGEESEDFDAVDAFSTVAQQFVQSPGGVWLPSEFTEDEQPPKIEDFGEEGSIDVDFDEEGKSVQPADFVDTDEVDYIVNTLENSGVYVDKEGNVTIYAQNIPGLYMDKLPLTAVPMEKALHRLNSDANAIDAEQARISSLQDVLSSIGSVSEDYSSKVTEIIDSLETFKYSDKVPDENLRSIGEGLKSLKDYLHESNLDDVYKDLGSSGDLVSDLQARLDIYYQSQYDKYDEKLRVIDALERLSAIRNEDPKKFEEIVGEIGGVVAMFRQVAQMLDIGYDQDDIFGEIPKNGSLEVDIGTDHLQDIIMDHPAYGVYGEDLIYLFFSNVVGEDNILNQDEFSVLYDDLSRKYELSPAGYQDFVVKIAVEPGMGLDAYIGLWVWDKGAPEIGESGGYEIGDYEVVEDTSDIARMIIEAVNNIIDDTLVPELEG
ncbi:hypothetical protein N8Z24_00280 [bacterium]|nr:hypothetical protein [bacterium]